ncbi:hypothetical protein [Mesorhizobium sp. M0698]|uniref:hypothetical protein n=1 Tax=Mesorhizobium sp. M0698 TaxID=2956987 RepID=UPI00333E0CA2
MQTFCAQRQRVELTAEMTSTGLKSTVAASIFVMQYILGPAPFRYRAPIFPARLARGLLADLEGFSFAGLEKARRLTLSVISFMIDTSLC